jgi:hypothetical protein
MSEQDIDTRLAALLAPPQRAPDRLFAARVDVAVDDLARLHAAERGYARGLLHEVMALVAALLAGAVLARVLGVELGSWIAALPLTLVLLVQLMGNYQPAAGSSPAP